MQAIYGICLTLFTFAAVEVGLDAFHPGKLFTYPQFVSLFSMIFAAAVMTLGLVYLKDTIFSDSLMWAGIFIIVYGVAIVFTDESARFRFLVLILGLGITVFTGYMKFGIEPIIDSKQKKSSPIFTGKDW